MKDLDQLYAIIDQLRSKALDDYIRGLDSKEPIEQVEYSRGAYDSLCRVVNEIRKLQHENFLRSK